MHKFVRMVLVCLGVLFGTQPMTVNACTGIMLKAEDGTTVYGRTMEWGAFDLNSRVVIIPRGHGFAGLTPDGNNGKTWKAKYGVVGLDMLKKMAIADGMNEKGLTVGVFYHPGYATYPDYQKSKAENSISSMDVSVYLLTRYATVDEAVKGLGAVHVVPVIEKAIGIAPPIHWMLVDASGKSVVIEFKDKKMQVFDNPLGVITNAPTFDWHMTNLRNYLNLSKTALPGMSISDMNFKPLGAGSGMIGLPGDSTPPSRFVRAVAWTQTARPLPNSKEALYELFRILDNFNLPLGSAEGSSAVEAKTEGMRSSTIWTTGWDVTNRDLFFHTQHNRRVRMVDMDKVDFTEQKITVIPLDDKKEQDIQDITP